MPDRDRDTHHEHPPVTRHFEAILVDEGIEVTHEARILDYGCGAGGDVYEYLSAGYKDVAGYDIHDFLELREPGDAERFHIDPSGRVPFPDNHFDFVFSSQVFEHVLNYDMALAEIYRVLKPGGASLHVFPSKWRPIEPHIFVPFTGVFQSHGYFLFWALVGIRNQFQKGLGARDVARRNFDYARDWLNYLGGGTLENLFGKYFDSHRHVELPYLRHSEGRSAVLYRPAKKIPLLVKLFRAAHTRAIIARKA